MTQFLGAFNDNFFKNALVILIAFQESNILGIPPKEMVALSAGIFILPFFIFSAFAGVLADKLDKKYIARSVKIAEVLIIFLAAYGFLNHHFAILLICLFLMGLHSAFFGPVKYAILPQHLKTDELLEGNSLVGAATFIAILLGTVLGGWLISLENFALNTVCIFMISVSVLGLVVSWLIPSAPAIQHSQIKKLSFNIYQLSKQVLRLAFNDKSIFVAIICSSWFWFVGVAFLSLIPPYVKDVLIGSQKQATIFLAIFTVGIAVGAYLCSFISKNKINLKLTPVGGIVLSFFSALIGLMHLFFADFISSSLIGLFFFFACIGGGLYSIPLITYIQKKSPPSERSQIIGACNIVNALAMVMSSQLIVLFFRIELSIPAIFIIIAFLNFMVLALNIRLARNQIKEQA